MTIKDETDRRDLQGLRRMSTTCVGVLSIISFKGRDGNGSVFGMFER